MIWGTIGRNKLIILYMHLYFIQCKWMVAVLEMLQAAEKKTVCLFPRGFKAE